MKPSLTPFAQLLVLGLGLFLLQGCSAEEGLSISKTKNQYTFNPNDYFKNKEFHKEMPFRMKSSSITAPLLNSKEDDIFPDKASRVKLSGAIGNGGGDFRLLYSPLKRFFVSANGAFQSKNSVTKGLVSPVPTTTTTEYEYSFWNNIYFYSSNQNGYMPFKAEYDFDQVDMELSVGYEGNIGERGIWDLLGGCGIGETKNSTQYIFGDEQTEAISSNQYFANFSESRNYYRLFLQNSIGYSTKLIETAFSGRFTYLLFTNQSLQLDRDIQTQDMVKESILLEPSIHFGIGKRAFRVFGDFGIAIPLTKSDVTWSKGNLLIGASYKF